MTTVTQDTWTDRRVDPGSPGPHALGSNGGPDVTTYRNVRDLLAEAVHEAFLFADFLIRKADDRWVLPREDTSRSPL